MVFNGAISLKEQKILGIFQILSLSKFSRAPDENAVEFLTIISKQLQPLVLVDLEELTLPLTNFIDQSGIDGSPFTYLTRWITPTIMGKVFSSFLAGYIPRSIRDHLPYQLGRLE